MGRNAAAADRIGQELKLIRKNVPGVRGSIAATSDGLLIAHDIHDMEPTQIAALVAALHAVAVRAAKVPAPDGETGLPVRRRRR